MDTLERLKNLTNGMELEADLESDFPPPLQLTAPSGLKTNKLSSSSAQAACSYLSDKDPYLGHAQLPNGRRITLLKSLLTSACERNCFYCPFRAGRDFRRETFTPDEMAQAVISLHRAGITEGAFLSSGVVAGGMRTQDKLLDTGEILRHKYNYTGYLHIKLMPGAERDQVLRAMQLADRISINLEAPNANRLQNLAPRKAFMEELLQPLRWVNEIRRSQAPHGTFKGRWPSMTTQFVVGAVGESDLELLSTTSYLYQRLGLVRAYFSAFKPMRDTPLENLPPESPERQLRLYQASFLLRDYGFELEDLPFEGDGELPRGTDPKLAWARFHLTERPIELNRAGKRDLLRVPGIGPQGAKAILDARCRGTLNALEDLRRIGINPNRAAPFILLNGKRPVYQMALL